ncbi:MAG: DNA gyrase/topoisomerase IV subunit A, partial [Bacteroidaceae bacterium]|nr:DNA gyrase/topoisomerase IV subunit A [Bacteroidaceae bacterium]
YPRIRIIFGGGSSYRDPLDIEVEEFIAVKGVKARGKRLTNYEVGSLEELEPLRQPEEEEEEMVEDIEPSEMPEEPETEPAEEEEADPDAGKTEDEIRDELNGQLRLF